MAIECLCKRCRREAEDGLLERNPEATLMEWLSWQWGEVGFRYGCEICGNKRCPHHADHRLECTNSNEPDQIGA